MIASFRANGVPAAPIAPQREVRCHTIGTVEGLSEVVAAARTSGRVAIGIETTSPEPMRAAIVGVSLATGAGEGFYVPIGHRYIGSPKQLKLEEVRDALAPLMADEQVIKVGHDLKYIDVALSRYGVRRKGAGFDVMIASYLLDAEAPNSLPIIAKRETGTTLSTFEQLTAKGRGTKLGFDEGDVETATDHSAKSAEV